MNNYDIYNLIVEELEDRVDSGEITLEFAESVNDLAYEKYVSESASDFLPAVIIGTLFTGICGALIGGAIHQFRKIKKAIKLYELMNKKLVPFSQLDEKVFNLTKFGSEAKEITGKKLSILCSMDKLYQYSKDGKPYIQFFIKVSAAGDCVVLKYKTIISDKISYPDDRLYYLACVTHKHRGINKDCIEWADSIIEQYKNWTNK